ncbi:uncharacterized protein RSE6_06783 [Rhynchosporium secalis]|uniref:Uncharacterized protein n=1 Tax=Rhynchosporium secalis TaxID=38038 RepID=A0A1E1MBA8_RHYSE|nr:uncharacterized protein RSE6_06783 [Rhynchosporium secalis]
MANGDHCCVIDGGFEPSSCPSRCTGGARLAECITQSAGNVRDACSCNKGGVSAEMFVFDSDEVVLKSTPSLEEQHIRFGNSYHLF